MVRLKSNPVKSLYEVDYSHPSVVFWFFGQAPVKKNGSKVNGASQTTKEKKVDKRPKGAKSQEVQDKSVRNGHFVHPLSGFPDVPPLTDLQIFITEAVMSEEGNSCSFEKIYEYVSQRWRSVRRRDGSTYTTDCRRAIQANLRHNPNHIALFRKDKSHEGNWTVCNNLEESAEAARDRVSEKKIRKENEPVANGEIKGTESNDEHEDNTDDDIMTDQSRSSLLPNQTLSNGSKTGDEHLSIKMEGNNTVTSPSNPSLLSPKDNAADMASLMESKSGELTELQKLVCECINENGGSCHFDMIVHHVTKNLNNKEMNTDSIKAAILSSLTDAKHIFKRDTKRTGWWTINPDMKAKLALASAEEKRKNASHRGYQDHSKSTSSSDDDVKKGSPLEQLTELQIEIIKAIHAEGGTATFDKIYEHVSKIFDTIKRRDGTPYTSECRRAIQASLSNNPPTRPFFKKENKTGTPVWSLAKRSQEILAELIKLEASNGHNEAEEEEEEQKQEEEQPQQEQEEEAEPDPEPEKEETKDAEEIIDQDSEEIDEEIHDEELSEDSAGPVEEKPVAKNSVSDKSDSEGEEKGQEEDEEEQEEESDEEEKPKPKDPEPKEDKHQYGSRLKRARKLQENASRRYARETNNGRSEKDTRFKRRRK